MNWDKVTKFSSALLTFYNDKKTLTDLMLVLDKLTALWDTNKELKEFFSSPANDIEQKKKFATEFFKMFKLDEYFVNTVYLIIDYKEYLYIGYFFNSLKKQILEKLNIKNVFVSSSILLKKEQKEELESRLTTKLQKNLVFYYSIDETLVMGIKVKIDDYSEEHSLGTQLQKITETLSELYIQ